MRVRIKVADLSFNQWEWLQKNIPEGQEFRPEDVRVCVELELTGQVDPIHREMTVLRFMGLMNRLARVERAQAAPTERKKPHLSGDDHDLLSEISEFPSLEHWE
jgi:hypothetical protein